MSIIQEYMGVNTNMSLKWLKDQAHILINKSDIDELEDVSNPVRGVYGIFVEEKCVYVGRSNSIYGRLFCSDGHITNLMKKKHTNQQLIDAMDSKKNIEIKILEKVPYEFDNYAKDMHRLALLEYQLIYEYQKIDQCLEQVPDGKNDSLEQWESMKIKLTGCRENIK